MNSLIQFIIRNYFVILFVVLETIAFSMVVNRNDVQHERWYKMTDAITGRTFERINSFKYYFNLKEENERLILENTNLRKTLKESYYTSYIDLININDTLNSCKFDYQPATVVNNSINKLNNYLIINKGLLHNIKPDMGIVSSEGVIGKVKTVGQHYSTVISLLNTTQFRISAKIKSSGYFGSMFWDGKDYRYATLTDIPYHVKLRKGDTIVTSGFSASFPPDIMIGRIVDYNTREGNFYEIRVLLNMDFKKITNVYIVENLHYKEIKLADSTNNHE